MKSRLPYDAAQVLNEFRTEVSWSKFGLIAQALFAHTLIRLGADIIDVRNPGHPDIIARLSGQSYNIEVEAPIRKTPRHLEYEDLRVLQNLGNGKRGYFCILDCGPPVSWICVDVDGLGDRAGEALRISILKAYADHGYSDECTRQFSELIVKEARHLRHLSYAQLRAEALDSRGR